MLFTKTVASSAVLALANASSLSQRSESGTGTYYGGNVAGGACSFTNYTIPSSLFGTASSGADWSNAANCGACVKVTGPSGTSVTVMIVDECPECASGSLDLFPTAFSTLADPTLGKIAITWDFVDCGITTPLSVISKSGVSAYWFSMQVVNANTRVASLEVSTDGGSTWQATTRSDYNYFENQSGFGTTTVSVKITSIDGDSIIIDSVTVGPGVTATASSNFGSDSSSVATAAAEVVTPSSSAALVVEAPSSTSEAAPVAMTSAPAQEAVPTIAAVALVESSSSDIPTSTGIKSTIYRTTSILRTTTRSPTTLTSTLPYTSSSSSSSIVSNTTVTVKATKYVEAAQPTIEAALPTYANTYPISVITISTCVPTVIYSVVTVLPTTTAIPTSANPSVGSALSYPANATLPVQTSTPSTPIFTGSAASLQGSVVLAAFVGLAALLM